MNSENNIIIIGGGLAGLTCAIHLLKAGFGVTLIEKNLYPQHKVCGEYISNEVLPYLKWLDADPAQLNPTEITRLFVSSASGKIINTALPLGGFGISRFTLDHFLLEKALQNGLAFINDTVNSIEFKDDTFSISTAKNGLHNAKIVIGAFGKRSSLDQKLERKFIQKKSPWLAVKAHYKGNIPSDLVALHNFKGGYCGVSKVENNLINICYLTDYESFKAYKSIPDFQNKVLYKNPWLKEIFENCIPMFDQPLTISQISFEKKEPVYNHILMIGDTAGLIHPLCGNGMAMAIHGAKICAELTIQFLNGNILSRTGLEEKYEKEWSRNFKSRLAIGKLLSAITRNEILFTLLLNLLIKFPSVLPKIIKKTHGKPII
ncbi:FAD-dependent oxidoreductase [Pedobacter ginsengisoli]|uniref:FAD-dependent oxidoreductase n=1 Tax=Pedobacter ginsengisoli TaxID=363852 RepID=A0A2D1U5E0_9SPHI|nr:NAD(P)/FAD-dependent oxidoreductase [Pedobacter ginsengisoli]ATP56812.1 FAD-dependent oxidoreductase [Pedobacter ginsengisoli]